jgi:hypothetical protein
MHGRPVARVWLGIGQRAIIRRAVLHPRERLFPSQLSPPQLSAQSTGTLPVASDDGLSYRHPQLVDPLFQCLGLVHSLTIDPSMMFQQTPPLS